MSKSKSKKDETLYVVPEDEYTIEIVTRIVSKKDPTKVIEISNKGSEPIISNVPFQTATCVDEITDAISDFDEKLYMSAKQTISQTFKAGSEVLCEKPINTKTRPVKVDSFSAKEVVNLPINACKGLTEKEHICSHKYKERQLFLSENMSVDKDIEL